MFSLPVKTAAAKSAAHHAPARKFDPIMTAAIQAEAEAAQALIDADNA